jgi:hypothetical protein
MNFVLALVMFVLAAVFVLLAFGHWVAGLAYRDEIGEECFREARYNLGYALRAGVFGALAYYVAMVLEGRI